MAETNQKFDKDLALKAWAALRKLFNDRGVKRQHLTTEKDGIGSITSRDYARVMHADYQPNEYHKWYQDFSNVFREVNNIIVDPPFGLRIQRGQVIDWRALFLEFEDNAPPPPSRGAPSPPDMGGGGAELGFRWHRRSIIPYETLLEQECGRFHGFGDVSRRRQVIEKLVTLYEATGDWSAATPLLQDLREINRDFKDYVFVADCCLRLGIAYYRLERWPTAEEAISEGLRVINQHGSILKDSKTHLRLFGYAALVRLRQDDPVAALGIMDEKVRPLVTRHSSTYVTATFHHRRAIIVTALRKFEDAHRDFATALKLRLECGAQFEVTRTLYYLGKLCEREGDVQSAVVIWYLCRQRQNRFEDAHGLARTQLALGNAFKDISQSIQGRARGKILEYDLLGGDLSNAEREMIERLAEGYYTTTHGELSTKIEIDELVLQAEIAYHKASYSAKVAGVTRIHIEAEAKLEELTHGTS